MYLWHILWVSSLLLVKKDIVKKDRKKWKTEKEENREGKEKGSCFFLKRIKMAREWSKKEPFEEVEKWKKRTKVWNRLEKGGITWYIENLHGFEKDVTNLMVNS